jgi:hypothetical protein
MGFFLKKNNINEINRAKLMMKYQTSKTFSENLLIINEQTLQDYEGNAERIDPEKEKRELFQLAYDRKKEKKITEREEKKKNNPKVKVNRLVEDYKEQLNKVGDE